MRRLEECQGFSPSTSRQSCIRSPCTARTCTCMMLASSCSHVATRFARYVQWTALEQCHNRDSSAPRIPLTHLRTYSSCVIFLYSISPRSFGSLSFRPVPRLPHSSPVAGDSSHLRQSSLHDASMRDRNSKYTSNNTSLRLFLVSVGEPAQPASCKAPQLAVTRHSTCSKSMIRQS